jgi:hypothetical protein
MTNARSKGGELSETCKTELTKIWIENEYRRKRDVTTKFTEKGIICEGESINLLNKKRGEKFVKNEKELSNEFICGTPDIIGEDIWDIKTSWDLLSYVQSDYDKANKTYYYQLLGYMILTDKVKGHIAYCLTNTPDTFITDELYKMSFQIDPETTEYKNLEKQIRLNMTFDDISENKRVKVFDFELLEEKKEELYKRIPLWRQYLNKLTL